MSAATYISSTSYSHSGDYRSVIKMGQAVLCDNGVDGTYDGVVASVAYAGGTTTVTLQAAACTANLADVQYGPTYYDTTNSESNAGAHYHTDNDDGGYLAISNLNDAQITFLQALVTAGAGTGVLKVTAGTPSADADAGDLGDVVTTSPAEGDVLIYRVATSKYTTDSLDLAELGDATISAPADGELLAYDSGTSKWLNVDISNYNVSELGDISVSSPVDGEALVWDDYLSMWVNGLPEIDLNDLADVTITTPADGDALVYDDYTSTWINGTPAMDLGDLEDVDSSAPNHGDVLTWNAYTSQWEPQAP